MPEAIPRYSKRAHGPPIPFIQKYYPDVSRGKLGLIDKHLVNTARSEDKDAFDQLPKQRRDLNNPIAVWQEKYPTTRLIELRRKDPSLRQAVRMGQKNGTITAEDIAKREAEIYKPPAFTHQFRDDPVAYAHAYYPGATQRSLARDNYGLYCKIRDSGRLGEFKLS
ncbi:MAG: hypothetical protein AAB573_04940 [Patescibacteria group bacterium]